MAQDRTTQDVTVTYKLRDLNENMVQAWKRHFAPYDDRVYVSPFQGSKLTLARSPNAG